MKTPGRWFLYEVKGEKSLPKNYCRKKISDTHIGSLAYFYKLCYYKEELFLFGVKDSIRLNFSS
jgi:hypothetical protein